MRLPDTLFVVAVVVLISLSPMVRAELTVCNKGAAEVSTALGYLESGLWSSRGWWNIAPGQCSIVLGDDLTAKKYYLYAEESGSSRKLSGEYPFCTQKSVFKVRGDKDCVTRGYQSTSFVEFSVGDSLSSIANKRRFRVHARERRVDERRWGSRKPVED